MQRLAPRMVVWKGGKCSRKERMCSILLAASERQSDSVPAKDWSLTGFDWPSHVRVDQNYFLPGDYKVSSRMGGVSKDTP